MTCDQVQVRRVDNEAATQWTTSLGEAGAGKFSVGYSVIEVSTDVITLDGGQFP